MVGGATGVTSTVPASSTCMAKMSRLESRLVLRPSVQEAIAPPPDVAMSARSPCSLGRGPIGIQSSVGLDVLREHVEMNGEGHPVDDHAARAVGNREGTRLEH